MRFPRAYRVVILATTVASSPSLAFAQSIIAGNSSTVDFNSCARPQSGCPETCDLPMDGSAPDSYFASKMPQDLGDPGHEGRLHANLRAAARVANPLACSLRLSAIHFGLQEDTLGRAFADLSVTGRRAFAQFRRALPQQAYCDGLPTQIPTAGCPAPAIQSRPSDAQLIAGCRRALDRAYSVANFLRTGQSLQTNPAKSTDRFLLGWIAVSGEDDQPHRPVNVPSSDFPQHDVTVVVPSPFAVQPNLPTVTVSSRFIIAQSRAPAPSAEGTLGPAWALRPEPAPRIEPNAEILIFVHGMDSRVEEATDIINALFRKTAGSLSNLVVIAVDLPSSGYADNLDYGRVSPLTAIGVPDGLIDFRATGETPLLDFIENFVVRFVDTLEMSVPGGVKNKVKAVIGGSLGGNMSFRLGRRTDLTWLTAVVAWSPASIWNAKGEGANLIDHQVVRKAWEWANDRDLSGDPNDLGPARITRRRDFFRGWDQPILSIPNPPFPPIPVVPAQSEQWSSNSWPCKRSSVAIARLERHETYDPRFLSWRWRLGAEQMLYSHQSRDATTGLPRYRSNRTRMLLACGTEDDFPGTMICSKTQATARDMTTTPGKAIFLKKTGHSIHNERRDFFAGEVVDFLRLGGRDPNEDWTGGPYWGSRGTFFADVTGEGRADAIIVNAGRVTVRRSTGSAFSPPEDWTGGPYYGSRGTFFADVTGDGRADAIVVNDDTVTVRRSTGSAFSPNEDWTRGPYWGSRGTFFADVTGDGRADAIVVNDDTVTVRRSTGSAFSPNEDWTRGPYYGSRGTFFADVTGDRRADAIVVNDDTVTVRRSSNSAFAPNEDWTGGPYYGSRDTLFADVTGEGRADAIVVNDDTITVRRSTGSAFGPNEDWTGGPDFGTRGTFFADVTGDRRADAIAVNNDTVRVRRSR